VFDPLRARRALHRGCAATIKLASYLRIEEREQNVGGLKRVVACFYESSCLGDCATGA
jgi:hypothetical protein